MAINASDFKSRWRRNVPNGARVEGSDRKMHLGRETLDMASDSLKNLKIAILATDGVEQVELTEPRKALEAAGAKTKLVSPKEREIHGWQFSEWGDNFPVDVTLNQARAEDFDALLLPGGVINPDK